MTRCRVLIGSGSLTHRRPRAELAGVDQGHDVLELRLLEQSVGRLVHARHDEVLVDHLPQLLVVVPDNV